MKESEAMTDQKQEQMPPCPRVELIPIKESWGCPECKTQNVVFAYERANGDKPSYANCSNCGVKVELGIARRAAAGIGQAERTYEAAIRLAIEIEKQSLNGDDAISQLESLLAPSAVKGEDEKCAGCGHNNVGYDGLCKELVPLIDKEPHGSKLCDHPCVNFGLKSVRQSNTHVLLTPETCTIIHYEDRQCPVCDGGLAVCAICGKFEAGLDEPCDFSRPARLGCATHGFKFRDDCEACDSAGAEPQTDSPAAPQQLRAIERLHVCPKCSAACLCKLAQDEQNSACEHCASRPQECPCGTDTDAGGCPNGH